MAFSSDYGKQLINQALVSEVTNVEQNKPEQIITTSTAQRIKKLLIQIEEIIKDSRWGQEISLLPILQNELIFLKKVF